MFGFVEYRRVKEEFPLDHDEEYCYKPNLPEETSFSELTSFIELNWGLYEIDIFEDEIPQDCKIEPVSSNLKTLLYSAKNYPPALAMMRHFVRKEKVETKEDFEKTAIIILERFLNQQSESPFFLAKALDTNTVERNKGGYYWIVDYTIEGKQIQVKWVVWDYYIYSAPIEHFKVDLTELEKRFGKKKCVLRF